MRVRRLGGAGLAVALCAGSALGQIQADNTSEAKFGQVQHFQHGSVYYMGHVRVAGNIVPWDPIPVTAVCNGVTRMNALTDVKGEFRLEPPATDSESGTSANNPKRVTAASLAGCKIRAQLEGFDSTELNVISNSIMDDPDLGTIVLKRNESTPGAAVSATTLAVPPEVQKEFARARSEARDHHIEAAERALRSAVQSDPGFAEAWYQLGCLEQTGHPEDALTSFRKAVAADANFISPYVHIAAIEAMQTKWEASLEAVQQSLKLDAVGSPQLWYLSALANLKLNRPRFAEASARTSLAMDPNHLAPYTEQLLATVIAQRGGYAEALLHLRQNLTYLAPGPNVDLIKKQIAQLERAQATEAKKQNP